MRPVAELTTKAAGTTPTLQNRHVFDGPIKFYSLSSSLVMEEKDRRGRLPTVLFAFSSLKSAASMLVLACEMGRQERNRVHVAILGRDESRIDDIIRVNGLLENCPIHWHDGRPDYASVSTDRRMMTSVRAAVGHIGNFAHLAAVIFDDSDNEDNFFKQALRQKLQEVSVTGIPIPHGAINSLRWLTRLEASALTRWSSISIDIIIHPVAESSGSLIRLLKSLQAADFHGLPLPGITIQLPPKVEPSVSAALSMFRWPPSSPGPSRLTVRRRTSPRQLTPMVASLQTVESFYPIHPEESHVLILSPDVELSPLFYHYLMLMLLEYKYSGSQLHLRNSLAGFSLETLASLRQESPLDETDFLLSQLPSSAAALYFGDTWANFHRFVTSRLDTELEQETPQFTSRLSADHTPAFMGYLLEMFRTQNSFMLYPSSHNDLAFATVHTETAEIPEEFRHPANQNAAPATEVPPASVLTAPVEEAQHTEIHTDPGSLASLLTDSSVGQTESIRRFPGLVELPLFSYLGTRKLLSESVDDALAFRRHFSVTHGGCKSESAKSGRIVGGVEGLFCR